MRKIEIQSLATFKGKGVVWWSYKRRVNFDPILSKNFWHEKILRVFWPIKSRLHFSSSVNRATSILIYIHNLSFLSSYKGFDDDYRYSMANQTRKRRRHLPFPILLLLLRLPLICLPNKYWNPSLSWLPVSIFSGWNRVCRAISNRISLEGFNVSRYFFFPRLCWEFSINIFITITGQRTAMFPCENWLL